MAQPIPDPDRKASALAPVAEGLAAIDSAHAELLAQSIATAAARAPALAAVAKALTAPAHGNGIPKITPAWRVQSGR
jgi:hypothetical protein